jgi:hypothetical protein
MWRFRSPSATSSTTKPSVGVRLFHPVFGRPLRLRRPRGAEGARGGVDAGRVPSGAELFEDLDTLSKVGKRGLPRATPTQRCFTPISMRTAESIRLQRTSA